MRISNLPYQVHLFGLMCALRFRNGLRLERTGIDGSVHSPDCLAKIAVSMSEKAMWRGHVFSDTLANAVCRGVCWACRHKVNAYSNPRDACLQRNRYYSEIFD